MKVAPPIRSLSRNLAWVASAILLLGVASGTGCISDNDSSSLPDLPAGATLVSASEYATLQAQPGFISLDSSTQTSEASAAAAMLAADNQTIAAAESLSGLTLMPPDPTPDANTVLQLDGNYLHTVPMSDGSTASFITMGAAWNRHNLATAITAVPTYDNQLMLYSKIYAGLDAKTIEELSLVDPALIAQAGQTTYPLQAITALNSKLAANLNTLVGNYNQAVASSPVPYQPRACESDVGDGITTDAAVGDGTGNQYGRLVSPKGIFANFSFPLQPHITCVKNQANRGTCVAFAVNSALEMQYHEKYGQFINLSEQALYSRATAVWSPSLYADGSFSSVMFTGMEGENWTVPYENLGGKSDYNPSYQRQAQYATNGTTVTSYTDSCANYPEICSDTAPQSPMSCTDKAGGYACGLSGADNVPNPSNQGARATTHAEVWDATNPQLSAALMALSVIFQNPVDWAFVDTPSWDGNTGGFVTYHAGESNSGGHEVAVVGYISNQQLAKILPNAPQAPTNGYFIVKNQWDNRWGDGGFAYVPWDFVIAYSTEMTVVHAVQ